MSYDTPDSGEVMDLLNTESHMPTKTKLTKAERQAYAELARAAARLAKAQAAAKEQKPEGRRDGK